MKIIGLNFRKWSVGGNNTGKWNFLFKRIYLSGWRWTPFIWIQIIKIK